MRREIKKGVPRLGSGCLACVWLLAGLLGPQIYGEVIRQTWQELLTAAAQAYSEGHTGMALAELDKLYAHYHETVRATPDLVDWLDLWYAELCDQEGRNDRAVNILEEFVRDFPQSSASQIACASLLDLYLRQRRWDEAQQLLEACQQWYTQDHDPEWWLLQQARLEFARGAWDHGYERVLSLIRDSSTSFVVRHAAWMLALEQSVQAGNLQASHALLTEPELRREPCLDVVWLHEIQLRVASGLYEHGQCREAIAIYRQIPSPEAREEQQRKNQAWLEQRLSMTRESSMFPAAVSQFADHEGRYLRQVLQRIRSADAKRTREQEAVYELHYAQAFMLCERYREAWILLEELTREETLEEEIRREAHYRWMRVAVELQYWDRALELAMDYLSRYPESEEVPYIGYMAVQAWEEQGDYPRSIVGLNDLLDQFADHVHAGRWYYHRGYLKMILEQYASARQDFQRCMQRFPEGGLYEDCLLWIGLAFMAETRYLEAVETWEQGIYRVSEAHPMYPEYLYRLATAHYAQQDWETGLDYVNRFLGQFPEHSRNEEGHILQGEIGMATGDLEQATRSFQQVGIESPLYEYAVFQIGKIYRAREQFVEMEAHFLEYAEHPELSARLRLAEALYWVGWALEQQGKEEQSGEVYLATLSRWGDRLEEREINKVLSGWYQLWEKRIRHSRSLELAESHNREPSLFPHDFNQWLWDQMAEALDEQKLTWYSRLALMTSGLLEQQGEPRRAKQVLWEVREWVPIACMDPEVIGKLGLLAIDAEETKQEDYFQYLLNHYPDTVHCAVAWFGKAKIAHKHREYEEAETWLERFFQDFEHHPLQIEAKRLQAENYIGLQELEQAISCFEELLSWRQARGRPHAEALLGMARCWVLQGEISKAIAGLQRVYTLYRGFPDLVAEAYQLSAGLFEQIGELQAAYQCWQALVENQDYWNYFDRDWAQAETKRLALRLEQKK